MWWQGVSSAVGRMIALFATVLIAFLSGTSFDGTNCCFGKEPKFKESALEKLLFETINEDRRGEGVPALVLNRNLCKLARDHAEDMLKNDFFGHNSSDGLNAQQRARKAGIKVPVYENIGWRSGPDKSSEMVLGIQSSFMKEPKEQRNHRYIILLKQLEFAGVGVAKKKDEVAIVQVFCESSPN